VALSEATTEALKDAWRWLQSASDSAKPTVYKYADMILDAAGKVKGNTHHEAFKREFLQEGDEQ